MAGGYMQPNDDVAVQILAVGTTVFVLIFLYMAKKLRDRGRAKDNFHTGGSLSARLGAVVDSGGINDSSINDSRGRGVRRHFEPHESGDYHFSSSVEKDENIDEDGDGSPPRIQKHMALADVVELVIYPVKSCAGVSYDQLQLTKTGFWGDRLWMIVEPHPKAKSETSPATSKHGNESTLWYRFVTQRECPRMALIQPKIQSTERAQAPAKTEASAHPPQRPTLETQDRFGIRAKPSPRVKTTSKSQDRDPLIHPPRRII